MSERSRRVKGERDYCQPGLRPRFAVTRNPILELPVLGHEGWLIRDRWLWSDSKQFCLLQEWLNSSFMSTGIWGLSLTAVIHEVSRRLDTAASLTWTAGGRKRQASVMLLRESEHLQLDVLRVYPDLSGHQTHILAVLDRRTNARTTGYNFIFMWIVYNNFILIHFVAQLLIKEK